LVRGETKQFTEKHAEAVRYEEIPNVGIRETAGSMIPPADTDGIDVFDTNKPFTDVGFDNILCRIITQQ
jgi:hypothetical protein